MGPKCKHIIHLCFICTYTHSLKVILYNILNTFVHETLCVKYSYDVKLITNPMGFQVSILGFFLFPCNFSKYSLPQRDNFPTYFITFKLSICQNWVLMSSCNKDDILYLIFLLVFCYIKDKIYISFNDLLGSAKILFLPTSPDLFRFLLFLAQVQVILPTSDTCQAHSASEFFLHHC